MAKYVILGGTLCALVVATLAGSSCASSKKQSESTPTQSATSATAAYEEGIDIIIKDLILRRWAPSVQDVSIDDKHYYTDSSGTKWVGFVVRPTPAVVDPGIGVMKEVSGNNWELVGLATALVQCALPAEVQAGLGFTDCPPPPTQAATAARTAIPSPETTPPP